jgi:hypothetical protein
MASFNQSPLGQTTISTGLSTTLVPGSSTVNAVITANTLTFVVNATGNTPTWYAPSSAVQSEGRRESKMIGLPPLL